MKKYICISTFSILFGVTAISAMPQNTPVPAPQEQLASPTATATNGRHTPDPNRRLKYLTKRLQLTADQQSQMLPILQQQEDQMQAVRSDTSLTRSDRRAKLGNIRQDSHAQVQNLLNDTQKQQFDQMVQDAHARAHKRRNQAASPSAGL